MTHILPARACPRKRWLPAQPPLRGGVRPARMAAQGGPMSIKDGQAGTMVEEGRFNWPRTFLLGFGFLGVSVIWSLYNAYVPVFLKDTFHLSSTVIGIIMTIDNVFAIVLLPFLGALSDRTRTRLGRRRPYILVGSILATAFFVLIPY